MAKVNVPLSRGRTGYTSKLKAMKVGQKIRLKNTNGNRIGALAGRIRNMKFTIRTIYNNPGDLIGNVDVWRIE